LVVGSARLQIHKKDKNAGEYVSSARNLEPLNRIELLLRLGDVEGAINTWQTNKHKISQLYAIAAMICLFVDDPTERNRLVSLGCQQFGQ